MSLQQLIAAVRSAHTTNELKRLMPPAPPMNRAQRRAAAKRAK